jgi:hypothetical protein
MRKFEFDYLRCLRETRKNRVRNVNKLWENGCHFGSDKKSKKQSSEKYGHANGIKEERLPKICSIGHNKKEEKGDVHINRKLI